MLSVTEQIAFVALVLLCVLVAARGFARIVGHVRSGRGAMRSDNLVARFAGALIDVGLQRTIFKARPVLSIFHAFIFFGFSFYLLVNINDILEAYVEGWTTIGGGPLANAFNLFSDLFSVLVLTGMIVFLVRRFGVKPKSLEFRKNVLLDAAVAAGGIRRDSLIVGVFILLHVGARWSGTALHLAANGHGDPWLPTAGLLAHLFYGASPEALDAGIHVAWWVAMGLIVLFLPYFPYSKHIHLMIAPVNLALGRRTPRGRMDTVTEPEAPGAANFAALPWPQLLDAYACIMCNRCQDVCPAYHSGTSLSPSALEINKRYTLNRTANGLDGLQGSDAPSLESVIPEHAVWACTTCYACVQVCPVGNEPMMDILEIRRNLVFDAKMEDDLADALRSLDEQGNSFGESGRKRSRWTRELNFEIKDAAKEPVEYLWYVGDFASFNQTCQDTTRKVARVFNAAGLDFGIIHRGEQSAGNDVRRVGEEGLFESLAEKNIELLDSCQFERIVTTDPHTYNTLKNEYPRLGGEYNIVHYSALLAELIKNGRIQLKQPIGGRATYHDPCYLGRYNGIFDQPRDVIRLCGVELVEMPRNRENSFCCGAGGGQIWMQDHDDMTQRPSEGRIAEAAALDDVRMFTVACPKDMTMYSDALKTSGLEERMAVHDIIDYVVAAMGLENTDGGAGSHTDNDPHRQ